MGVDNTDRVGWGLSSTVLHYKHVDWKGTGCPLGRVHRQNMLTVVEYHSGFWKTDCHQRNRADLHHGRNMYSACF